MWTRLLLALILTVPAMLWLPRDADASAPVLADTSCQSMAGAQKRSVGVSPIVMYDSDVGFGLGGKGMVKRQFEKDESLDLILFGSSKGEQWYAFGFSIPDAEIRQGTCYLLAFDLKLEYSKYLKSNFFGFGNDSEDNDWQFPKECADLELGLARTFTKQIVGEVGVLFNHTSVYGYEGVNRLLGPHMPGAGEHLTSYLRVRLRWDSRDSRVHPRRGWKLGGTADFASKSLGGDFSFQRYRVELSKYRVLVGSDHVLAVRLWTQEVAGTAPYYEQSIIGGGWTTRGFKADRFIDRALMLTSVEYRFPMYGRIGGVLFADSGRVFSGIRKAAVRGWKTNWGLGLRLYLPGFVVRLDAGASKEGVRFFTNFGQVF